MNNTMVEQDGKKEEKITDTEASHTAKSRCKALCISGLVAAATVAGFWIIFWHDYSDPVRKRLKSEVNNEVYMDSKYKFDVAYGLSDSPLFYTIKPKKISIGKAEYPQLRYYIPTNLLELRLNGSLELNDSSYRVSPIVVDTVTENYKDFYRSIFIDRASFDFNLADKVMKHYIKEMKQEEAHKTFFALKIMLPTPKALKDYAHELKYSEPESAK